MRWINSCPRFCAAALLVTLSASGVAAERIYSVGFAQDTMQNDWRAAQVLEMQQALAPYKNIRFIYTDAKGNPARQALDAEQLVSQGVDFLVTSPRDPNIMTPVINRIYNAGTPVILLTRKIKNNRFTTFISADDTLIARAAARHLIAELGGKGKVVMLQGVPTATTARYRAKGFRQEIAGTPGIKIVAEPVGNYLRADAIRETEKIIKAGIRFDAIYAHSDSMAAGARIALTKAGINPKRIKIVGIDYIPEARVAILSGDQSASFTYPTAGKAGAKTILDLIKGRKIKKYQTIPFIKVTRKNADKINTVIR